MPAYVILDIEITDPERFAQYIQQGPAVIARYGGRYVVRGGEPRVLEGSWDPRRLVILEFDSVERAQAWWDSDDYAGPKALRQACSVANTILVRGV